MAKIRPWAFWRRSLYGSAALLTVAMIAGAVYQAHYYQPASCFDAEKNGGEADVDCGGTCVRICAADIIAPRVMWVNSFLIADGQYNTVAYIENQNQLAGTAALSYTLELLNGGTIVATRSGTTVLPPNSIQPIFVGRIFTDGRPVTETRIRLNPEVVWQPATAERNQFRSADINLLAADSKPRLNVTLENTALTDARNVDVVATIFNADGEPVTASQTFIEYIAPRSTEEIVFTWPNSIAKTVRSCIVPTDVILGIDLSGSMNNDGATPPQPITDALAAAREFVTRISGQDQVGLTTFASDASLSSTLTRDTETVADIIQTLTIAPQEETGFTNTERAFQIATAELNSERHNENARRVFVLLTDGLPTAAGDTDIVGMTRVAAEVASASGIDVYAIGLGNGVDRSFVESVASSKEQAFYAPTTADLATIYQTITSSLCESGATKIDVIPTPNVLFIPLR